jgi:acyl-CoA dehydrogenase
MFMDEQIRSNLLEALKPRVADWEQAGYIPKEGWRILGENGLIGISSEETGLQQYYNVCKQLLSFNNVGLLASYTINEIAYRTLLRSQDGGMNEIVDQVKQGTINMSMCITEEHAGSDINSIETCAIREGDHYVVNGRKILISNGPIADYFLVAVKTSKVNIPLAGISILMVEKDNQGIKQCNTHSTAGVRLMPLGEIEFSDAKIRKEHLLGVENRGIQYLSEILHFERFMISIMAIAICEHIYHEIQLYLQSKELFGKKLKDFQHIKFTITEYYARIRILKSFILEMMERSGIGADKHDVLLAKIQSTQLLTEFVTVVSQWYGGGGYMSNHWISNLFNDVRWTKIAGGSNELLTDVLGNHLINFS